MEVGFPSDRLWNSNSKIFGQLADIEHDTFVGFQVISTDDIDDLGIPEIIRRIRQRVGDTPVYLRCVATYHLVSYLTVILVLI